jgi:predicted dinucleotide-binding enzyme
MNITIVGSGNVGRALGEAWNKAGHRITYAARDPASDKAAELKAAGFAVVALNAARNADVVVLAIPWSGVEATLAALGPLPGKVLVDATNPLTPKLELALGFSDSAGETVARLSPRARVVKAFNTTGAGNMANSLYPGGKVVMPIASDDAEGKKIVMSLASDLGFEPVDAGPLAMSRHLEPLAMLWIKLAYAQGLGMQFGFSILRR